MADMVGLGAGMCGLASAALLAENGHDVVVLERNDAGTPPSGLDAWQGWSRHGVAQFRHPHRLHRRAGRSSTPTSPRCGTPWPGRGA